MKKHFSKTLLIALLITGKCYAQQDYGKLNRDRNMFRQGETKLYTADTSVLTEDFGTRKNNRSFIVTFPLKRVVDETQSFSFTANQIRGTAIRGVESKTIQKVYLSEKGFDITFDPAGKTGPVDALIIVRVDNGNIPLRMTGTLIEPKHKQKQSEETAETGQ